MSRCRLLFVVVAVIVIIAQNQFLLWITIKHTTSEHSRKQREIEMDEMGEGGGCNEGL